MKCMWVAFAKLPNSPYILQSGLTKIIRVTHQHRSDDSGTLHVILLLRVIRSVMQSNNYIHQLTEYTNFRLHKMKHEYLWVNVYVMNAVWDL